MLSGFARASRLGIRPPKSAAAEPSITSPPGRKEFAIQLEDTRGLYLAWGLVLSAAARHIDALRFPRRRQAVPFFAIRGGEGHEPSARADGTLQPAAFAYIKAQYTSPSPSVEYLAMADARGQFALFLPSPNPLTPPPGVSPSSPNTTSRRTIAELTWPLTMTFFYQPTRQNFLCTRADGRLEIIEGQKPGITDAPPSQSGVRCVPDQPSLAAQAAASVYSSTSAPAAASLPANMAPARPRSVQQAQALILDQPQPLSPP